MRLIDNPGACRLIRWLNAIEDAALMADHGTAMVTSGPSADDGQHGTKIDRALNRLWMAMQEIREALSELEGKGGKLG